MKQTHTRNSEATAHTFRQYVSTFINEHAQVFEALTRQATPFGGNLLPADRVATAPQSAETIGQQVDELARTVTQLNERVRSIQSLSDTILRQSDGVSQLPSSKNDIGINRFKTLNR